MRKELRVYHWQPCRRLHRLHQTQTFDHRTMKHLKLHRRLREDVKRKVRRMNITDDVIQYLLHYSFVH